MAHGPIIQPRSLSQKSRVAGLEVEAVGQLLRRLDREARRGRARRPWAGPVVPEV